MNCRDHDVNARQWMKEALVSRNTIQDLAAANQKLHRELGHKTFQLQVIDDCISKLGMTDKVQNALFETKQTPRMHEASETDENRPKRSPRKAPDALIMGGPENKFAFGSESHRNYVGQYSPPKEREISNPKKEPPTDSTSPRRLKHDTQLFGSATEANKFHHGSAEHLALVENHSPKRTREVTEYPKMEHVYVSGSEEFHKTAAYRSSHPGQIERNDFGRSWPFQREEKVLRETKDLFGNDRKQPGSHVPLTQYVVWNIHECTLQRGAYIELKKMQSTNS
ncbi:hypothetical protein LEN26_008600 [Aphanomyces euteiches]|nr:hypothetical protein AeMF1_010167 [Aphanomyces euteiches]KAH9130366.1 hypothetical protein LEN26_008600 [Aphanomyces euteiches]KAH9138231.1 hypothetical protein AeRB84_017416 [Aphanomyces euteiches]KAH9192213.1 hypothetical protein AeNC1_005813 [Aphanomyces euteiches]